MAVPKKNPVTNKWDIQIRYKDSFGNSKKTTRRGFNTKKEAEQAALDFRLQQEMNFNMKFSEFVEIYMEDASHRLKLNTMKTKKITINKKLLPYFGNMKMNEITPATIRKWQNEMIKKDYKPTYLKTMNNQLSAIFNYAVQFHGLKDNPCKKAGSMGKSHSEEMKFWTKDEFTQFADQLMNKQVSYTIFKIFFWTGMRLGELLALTPSDIDFDKKCIIVNKSYQFLDGEDIITDPKTPKSKREITVVLCQDFGLHKYEKFN